MALKNQTKHGCLYCGKEFRLKKNWYEHELICELIHKKTPDDDPTDKDSITTEQLYGVINVLIKKQQIMEKEIRDLKKHTTVKLSIIDWLTENIKPTLLLKKLLESFSNVIEQDILYLKTNSMTDTLKYIIERNIEEYSKKNKNNSDWPIFAYCNDSTQQRIYFYDNNIQKWKDNTTIMDVLWYNINNNLLSYLIDWKQKEQKQLSSLSCNYNNDDIETEYNTTLLKIVDNTKNDTYIKTIKNTIYNKIKKTINTVSYNFH